MANKKSQNDTKYIPSKREERLQQYLLDLLVKITDTPLRSKARDEIQGQIDDFIFDMGEEGIYILLVPIGVVVPWKGFIWNAGTDHPTYHTILSD